MLAQIGEFLKGLSTVQRLLLIGGAVAVAATLFVFVQLIGKPDYKTLYSGLGPGDAQAVAAQLKARNWITALGRQPHGQRAGAGVDRAAS